jgi:hypothetical protein
MTRSIAAFCFALLFAGAAHAAPLLYTADLTAELPGVVTTGTGETAVVYDPDAQTLRVTAEFRDLVAPTTAAHIHCCVDPPGTVGVATPVPTFPGFPLGVTLGSYDQTFDLTLASSWNPAFVTNVGGGTLAGAEAALALGLEQGRAYLNIHSTVYPGGEIRGFLQAAVPEPAAMLLMGVAAAALLIRRRRRPCC